MGSRAEAGTRRDLCVLLSQAAHALTLELTAALAEVGISPRAHCVLSHALQAERSQGELAALCDLDKTTMVVTMDELERAGLASRRPSGADRRARIIAVTPAGRELVERGDRVVARVREQVLGVLPSEQQRAFLDGLVRLVEGPLAEPPRGESGPAVRRPRQRHPARPGR